MSGARRDVSAGDVWSSTNSIAPCLATATTRGVRAELSMTIAMSTRRTKIVRFSRLRSNRRRITSSRSRSPTYRYQPVSLARRAWLRRARRRADRKPTARRRGVRRSPEQQRPARIPLRDRQSLDRQAIDSADWSHSHPTETMIGQMLVNFTGKPWHGAIRSPHPSHCTRSPVWRREINAPWQPAPWPPRALHRQRTVAPAPAADEELAWVWVSFHPLTSSFRSP